MSNFLSSIALAKKSGHVKVEQEVPLLALEKEYSHGN